MKRLSLLSLSVMTLVLGGCMEEPKTWVSNDRVEVHEDQFTDTVETSLLNEDMLHAVGVYYYRYGNGPLTAAVSFDPSSKTNTSAKAAAEVRRIENGLRANGIRDVRVITSASPKSGDRSMTVLSFKALTAQAPEKCGLMPGMGTPNTLESSGNVDPKYHMGCTIETMMARQISRPGDLLGRPGFESNADGRRQAKVIMSRGYYGDAPNQPLGGEKASSGSN